MGAILPAEMTDRVTHVKAWYIPLGKLLSYVKEPACTYKPVRVVSYLADTHTLKTCCGDHMWEKLSRLVLWIS